MTTLDAKLKEQTALTARLNALELRKPKVDPFEQSRRDIEDNVKRVKPAPPKKVIIKGGGIPKILRMS
jgi:hypothetical protein